MNIEEIKRNAPEGATHYEIDGNVIYYYKLDSNIFYIHNGNDKWTKKPIEWLVDAKPL